ncbi:MAG: hypothetical protein ACUVTH_07435 [Thermogutta sp.]
MKDFDFCGKPSGSWWFFRHGLLIFEIRTLKLTEYRCGVFFPAGRTIYDNGNSYTRVR